MLHNKGTKAADFLFCRGAMVSFYEETGDAVVGGVH